MISTRFEDATAQAQSLGDVANRPWPLPERSWVMGQTWLRLLFAHWRVAADVLRPHVPHRLELEEYDGSAWVGLTPFRIEGLRARGLLPLPLLSSFNELNCRTYVRVDDRPGIWFFSLDASSRAAVEAARRIYKLPYNYARIHAAGDRFDVRRIGEPATFASSYRGRGDPQPGRRDSLEYFLTERYCLYADDGRLRADIHHSPWPLERAEATVTQNGISPVPLEGEPLLHFSARQDVLIWSPETV
jgi:uncharacterized protein